MSTLPCTSPKLSSPVTLPKVIEPVFCATLTLPSTVLPKPNEPPLIVSTVLLMVKSPVRSPPMFIVPALSAVTSPVILPAMFIVPALSTVTLPFKPSEIFIVPTLSTVVLPSPEIETSPALAVFSALVILREPPLSATSTSFTELETLMSPCASSTESLPVLPIVALSVSVSTFNWAFLSSVPTITSPSTVPIVAEPFEPSADAIFSMITSPVTFLPSASILLTSSFTNISPFKSPSSLIVPTLSTSMLP